MLEWQISFNFVQINFKVGSNKKKYCFETQSLELGINN